MKRITISLIAFIIVLSGFKASAISSTPFTNPSETKNAEPGRATVKSAFREFLSLSRKERRERIKEVKLEIKKFKASKNSIQEPNTNQLLLVILAILLPPLAVYLHEGVINSKFWLDLILTLLGFIPGVIYALIVVLAK